MRLCSSAAKHSPSSRAAFASDYPVDSLTRANDHRRCPSDHRAPAEQAATIVNEAFLETWWNVLVWLAMTTGARRGELRALSWDRFDMDNAVLSIRTSIAQDGAETWGKLLSVLSVGLMALRSGPGRCLGRGRSAGTGWVRPGPG